MIMIFHLLPILGLIHHMINSKFMTFRPLLYLSLILLDSHVSFLVKKKEKTSLQT